MTKQELIKLLEVLPAECEIYVQHLSYNGCDEIERSAEPRLFTTQDLQIAAIIPTAIGYDLRELIDVADIDTMTQPD